MNKTIIPVITIDGPSGCGKGTIAQQLAKFLNWHWLDSGALYRAVAWAVEHYQIPIDSDQQLSEKFAHICIEFQELGLGKPMNVYCDNQDITQIIRTERCAALASQISARPVVRQLLLQKQRDFLHPPGLVADGRDMGTVVFPDAYLKFYFVASIQERANRRYLQLKELGINANLSEIYEDLAVRDQRDSNRTISPLKPALKAVVIDTTTLSIEQVFTKVSEHVQISA